MVMPNKSRIVTRASQRCISLQGIVRNTGFPAGVGKCYILINMICLFAARLVWV